MTSVAFNLRTIAFIDYFYVPRDVVKTILTEIFTLKDLWQSFVEYSCCQSTCNFLSSLILTLAIETLFFTRSFWRTDQIAHSLVPTVQYLFKFIISNERCVQRSKCKQRSWEQTLLHKGTVQKSTCVAKLQ